MTDLRDPIQFDRAYHDHAPAMLASANRVLRDTAAAEDVVQDVFMHLWRKPAAFDARPRHPGQLPDDDGPQPRPRPLAHPRGARRRRRARQAADPPRVGASAEDAAEPVIRRDSCRRVLRALDKLPGRPARGRAARLRQGPDRAGDRQRGRGPARHRQEPRAPRAAEGPHRADRRRVSADGLTIREVASRTGVEAATLRMWEQRYGFPEPERLPSGHRRYSHLDVELIRQVTRDREAGLELKAAVENAKRAAPRRAAGDRRRLDLRRAAPAPPRPEALPAAQAHPDRGQPRDRGRVLGRRRARHAVRQLPARALLPRRRARAGATWPHRPSARSCSPTSTTLRRARRRRPSRCRSTAPSRSGASGRWCATRRPSAPCCAAWERPGQDDVPDGERASRRSGAWSRSWCARPSTVAYGIVERVAPRPGGGHRGPAGRGRWSPSSPA